MSNVSGVELDAVSFVNDVVPIFTRAGCNSGKCHAKAGAGQNGFQLSLLGFQPHEDHEHLTKEGRGRRLSLANPEQSLLLRKASGQMPHGGGIRLPQDSPSYKTVFRWIAEGAQYSKTDDPEFVSLEVAPARAALPCGAEFSIAVTARYADGSQRDVSPLALYEANDPARATVDGGGGVTLGDLPGKVAIMVRYQGKVAVVDLAIPTGAIIEAYPQENNFIDKAVFANLREMGIPASVVVDDSTFLRRVTIDIAGRLPSVEEAAMFIADVRADKRALAIDRLLQSSDYADYFANKWTALLKNRRDEASDLVSNFAFHAWIRDSLLNNKPYHHWVRELLAATGNIAGNPAVAWYKRVKDPKEQMEDVAQLFLGVRMQCAQCHDHPFERWKQDDYYALAAYFAQVGRKPTMVRGESLIFHKRGAAAIKNPQSGKMVKPGALGELASSISPDNDPRLALADWMSQPSNPFFAKALVNRYWKHFMDRGLIEPEDDLRETNPPSNPALLAALQRHFLESGFDLKELVRAITRSQTYQLSSQPVPGNRNDAQNHARFAPRRLSAEVLLDAIDQVTGGSTDFANLPPGTRAVSLPDTSYNAASPFLRVFGRPSGASVCECERVQSSSLSQSLYLLNAKDIRGKLACGNGRAERLSKTETSLAEKTHELYLACFARPPTEDELSVATVYLSEPRQEPNGNPMEVTKALRENLEDLLWALINTREFQFNH